jgi:hypothetical protein
VALRSGLSGLRQRLSVGLLPVALWGCHLGYRVDVVATPEVDPLARPAGLATICVLRPQTFGALATFQHYDNGRLVAVTQGSRIYACHLAEPGWHRLVARSDNDAALDLKVRAGELHFVQLEVRLGPDAIRVVDPDEGLRAVPRMRYVVAVPTAGGPPLCKRPVPAAPDANRGCPVVLVPL